MAENEMWIASPYGFLPEVTRGMTPPEKVEILDLTLDEDGEGMSGAHLTGEAKVEIASLLDEMGVARIGVLGFPTFNLPEEMALLRNEVAIAKEVAQTVKRAKLCSFINIKEDIDRALEVGVWGIIIRRFVTEYFDIPRIPIDQKIKEIVELGKYARGNGLHVSLLAQDFTRTSPDDGYMKEVLHSVMEQFGVDEICVTDSEGLGNPFGYQYMVRLLRDWFDIPVQVHCHDHLGLGAANSCAAVTAGASVIHTTVNGLGHFAGMTALEEAAVALKIGFGIDCGIEYNRLYELSKMVQRHTGIEMPPHKPVVGDRAFVLSEDIKYIKEFIERQAAGIPMAHYLPYLPEFVGNRHFVVMAHKVTRLAVEYNLKQKGLKLPDEQIDEIYGRVKALVDREQRVVKDEEFADIVEGVVRK